MQQHVTPENMAKSLALSRRTILSLCAEDGAPVVRLSSKAIRIRVPEFFDWLKEREAASGLGK